MIKIKIIIILQFFLMFFLFFYFFYLFYSDCVVNGYWLFLWAGNKNVKFRVAFSIIIIINVAIMIIVVSDNTGWCS